MKVLAIESSGMTASVALATEEKIIGEYTVNYKKTHSQTLLPMIDELLTFTQQDLHELDAIAVSAGPGSFTGLRIGCATAKGMALALDKPVVTVPTLDAMAYNFQNYDGIICPMMDARRDRVYTGIYNFSGGSLNIIHAQDVEEIAKVLEWLNSFKKNVILLGDASRVYSKQIKENLKVPYITAPPHMSEQSASSVAALAVVMIREGKTESAAQHKPIYLRPSQAESEKMRGQAVETK